MSEKSRVKSNGSRHLSPGIATQFLLPQLVEITDAEGTHPEMPERLLQRNEATTKGVQLNQ
jgi:hypothetical protein